MRYLTVASLFAGIVSGWALSCRGVTANEPERPPLGRVLRSPTFTSEPIESGYVIADGQYLPPPYIIQVRGRDVILSGLLVHVVDGAARPGGSRQYGGATVTDRALDIQRWLKEGNLLFLRDQRLVWVNARAQAHWLLRTLDTDDPPDFKLDQIEADSNVPVDRAFWTDTIREFQPSTALRERLDAEISEPLSQRTLAAPPAALMYALNVGGMALVVLAFGALLGHQPPRACQCQTCAQCGDGSTFLIRNVALIVVLSAFDLGCTVLGTANGVMAELNPMAGSMIHSPVLLSAFKLTATLAGAGILIHLRRNRRAQVASWWVCLVCSLLAFRWVSFHSLFMA
jgi:hypothetical protein